MSLYSATVLADSPIRYYRGSISDIGSQGQNGTVVGSITTGSPGLLLGDPQTSINFGGNGYVNIPTTGLPSGANPWSMECWVMWPSAEIASISFDSPMDFGTDSTDNAALYLDGTGLAPIHSAYGTTDLASGQSVVADTVFYIIVAYDGSIGYIDVFSSLGHVSASTTTALNIVFGGASFGNSENGALNIPFYGIGQEFAWYNYALSATRKLAHYNAGIFVPAPASLYAPFVTPGAVIGPSIWQGPPGLKYPSKMGPVIRRANGIFRGGGGLMGKNILRRKWWQVL